MEASEEASPEFGGRRDELLYFLNFPSEARAERPHPHLRPLHPGCTGNVHGERKCIFIHEIAPHAERAGIHPERIAALVEHIRGKRAAADVATRLARAELLILPCVIRVKGGRDI